MPLVPLGSPSKKIGHQAQSGSARLRNMGHRACSGTCFAGGHRAARCPVPALLGDSMRAPFAPLVHVCFTKRSNFLP